MATVLPAAAQPSKVRRLPASAGDQASVKGEGLRGTVIGAMGAPAEDQTGSLEAFSRSWGQSRRFSREQALSGGPAYGEADTGFHVLVIAATTAVAAARPVMSLISGDGHPGRHHAALDEGQAHAEPQQDRQERNARPMPGPAFHGEPKMALLNANGKSLQLSPPLDCSGILKRNPRSPICSIESASNGRSSSKVQLPSAPLSRCVASRIESA